MGLSVMFSRRGTFTHCLHIHPHCPLLPSPCLYHMPVSLFFYCGHFWCFPFWQELWPGLRCLSVFVPEACAETHCFFSESRRLLWDSAMMLPPTLSELPGSQAPCNSLALPSAVGTRRSGPCPHPHIPFCVPSGFHLVCYRVGS